MAPRSYSGDIKIAEDDSKSAEAKLALFIRGQRVKATQAQITVLGCLHRHLGYVVPYETLCAEIGHRMAGNRQRHILRQYVAQLRRLLKEHKAAFAIAAVDQLGYALCQTR